MIFSLLNHTFSAVSLYSKHAVLLWKQLCVWKPTGCWMLSDVYYIILSLNFKPFQLYFMNLNRVVCLFIDCNLFMQLFCYWLIVNTHVFIYLSDHAPGVFKRTWTQLYPGLTEQYIRLHSAPHQSSPVYIIKLNTMCCTAVSNSTQQRFLCTNPAVDNPEALHLILWRACCNVLFSRLTCAGLPKLP